jgi:hypothetical protein
MKITVIKNGYYTIYRRSVFEATIDIDPELYQQIESGQHSEYDGLAEWVCDQDTDIDWDWQSDDDDSDGGMDEVEYTIEEVTA